MSVVWPIPIRAIIFDSDGTLIDTEWAYSWAHKEITGEELTWDLKPQLMSLSTLETCKLLVKHYNLDTTPEELVIKRTQLVEQCWDKVELLPGAKELIEKFAANSVPMAIATSSRRPVFDKKMQNHIEFVSKLHHVVCGNDVTRGKPAPDIFLAAMNQFGIEDIKPEEVLVFEDSPTGVLAANAAKMPTVFVPDPNMNVNKSLADAGAEPITVIKSLNDFDFNQFIWAK